MRIKNENGLMQSEMFPRTPKIAANFMTGLIDPI